jgi:2-hydroxy-3-keto-5-methylthiopentenyl-1-phosphate phosphatase
MRFYKTALKEHSALFRLLNAMANPVFDTILEQIVSKEDIDKAKAHARAAMLDEPLPYDGDQYLSDSRWWEI